MGIFGGDVGDKLPRGQVTAVVTETMSFVTEAQGKFSITVAMQLKRT